MKNKLALTSAQASWAKRISNSKVAPPAIRWAESSHWATQFTDLASVIEALQADLSDGDLHGATSRRQARVFLAVLKRAAALEAPEKPLPVHPSSPLESFRGTCPVPPDGLLATAYRPPTPFTLLSEKESSGELVAKWSNANGTVEYATIDGQWRLLRKSYNNPEGVSRKYQAWCPYDYR
jgi:hypothetical protein